MGVDPRRLDLEQAGELTGMRCQHRRSVSLDPLEAEQRVGVDDCRQVGFLQQPSDELPCLVAAPESRPKRERAGALCRLEGFLERPLDRLQQARLDDR